MKRFIKVLTAAAVLVAAAQGVWAGGYSGDLQLTGGVRLEKLKVDCPVIHGADSDAEASSCAFALGVNSYNLFGLNDMVSLGFMISMDAYIGACTKGEISGQDAEDNGVAMGIEFLVGPAVGFDLGEYFKLQVSPGFAFGGDKMIVQNVNNAKITANSGMLGFGIDAQMKFFPNKRHSPLVGLRYVHYMPSTKVEFEGNDFDWMPSEEMEADDEKANIFDFYIGFSKNFGK